MVRLCAGGVCLRYWCVTTKCSSVLDDTAPSERVAAVALSLVLVLLLVLSGRRHRSAVVRSAVALAGALICAPIYHATVRYLDQLSPGAATQPLPRARYSCKGAIFAGSCVSEGKMQIARVPSDRPPARPKTMRLATNWMASHKGLIVEPADRIHPAHRVEGNASSLSVLAAVPGDTGCRQPAHFLFNFIMPMWDSLEQLGWSPARVSLFLDCTGMGPTRRGGFAGVELEEAASFVHEAARVLTVRPLRSLPRLLHGSYASRTCFGGTVLVGMPCAVLDEYNRNMNPASIRTFRTALMRAVLGESRVLRPRYHPHSAAGPPGRVVYLIHRRSRTILNEAEVLSTIRAQPGVDRIASRVISFEGLSLRQQMELALTANVLVGLDGSGFLNAVWMRSGSTAVYIMPFGNRYLREQQGSNFFNLMRAVGVALLQLHVDDMDASSLSPEAPCMRCILDARERWLNAEGNHHVERAADSGPSSARRLSELSHRAKGLWSTDHRCAALTANTRENVLGASSRRLSPVHHGDGRRLKEGPLLGRNFSKDSASHSPSCAGVPNWCIDGQDTNVTAALMASVASAVRAAAVI